MKKVLPLLLLLTLSLICWWRLSLLPIRGDGLLYFLERIHTDYLTPLIPSMATFYWSGVVLGNILSTLFGTNFIPYGWVEVGFMLATIALFFQCILIITKKISIASIAGLFMGSSYYGNWDMYAGGIYPWFLERIPLMLFLIPSFTFLHLFLEKNIKKYYLFSVFLFTISIYLAHWGVFFTAPFVLYPFFWQIFNKENKIKTFKYLVMGLMYAGVSGIFIFLQKLVVAGVGPSWSFGEFLLNPGKYEYFLDILRQLTYWSTYLPFISLAERGFVASPITRFVIAQTSLEYMPWVVVIYITAFLLIYIKLKKFRAILLTSVLSIFSIFYLNSYFGQYHIASQPGASRYLYLPTYLFAIFWSLFVLMLFNIKKRLTTAVGWIIIIGFYLTNYWLISEHFKWNYENHDNFKVAWYQLVYKANISKPGNTIFIPEYFGGYEVEFLNDQFRDKQIKFVQAEQK